MKSEEKENILVEQVDSLVKRLEEANSKRDIKKAQADYTYIREFFKRIIHNRNSRAGEIDSPKYQEVLKIAQKLLPYPVSFLHCMDGRVFGPLIGLFGRVGDSVGVAGGIINEFVRHEDSQEYYLIPDANYAHHLRKAMQKHDSPVHVEIMDSHLGCAAREVAENAKGKFPKDHGLFADVIQKDAMRGAVVTYIKERYKGTRELLAMQISLDLHNGCMYMGLGTQGVIKEAMKKQSYDSDMIAELVRKEMIISTEQIASDPVFVKEFEKHDFPIDLANNYGESAVAIWKSVEKMYPQLSMLLKKKLYKVYPIFDNNPTYAKEVEERALIILVNTFIGYLHKKHYDTYPFAHHEEEGIFLGKGTNIPYAIDMFVVSTMDMDAVTSNVELSASLVRNNRKAKRVAQGQEFFADANEFIAAPVCAMMQVKVLDDLLEKEWEHVSHINWEDFEEIEWSKMSDQAFLDYLEEQDPDVPIAVANAINKLRHRLAFLYDIDRGIAPFLIEQDIVILPVISDTSLRVRAVIPFLKTGYR